MSATENKQRLSTPEKDNSKVRFTEFIQSYEELKEKKTDKYHLKSIRDILVINQPHLAKLQNDILSLKPKDVHVVFASIKSLTDSKNQIKSQYEKQCASSQQELAMLNTKFQKCQESLNQQKEQIIKMEQTAKDDKAFTLQKDEEIKAQTSKIKSLEEEKRKILQEKERLVSELSAKTQDYENKIENLTQTINIKNTELLNSQNQRTALQQRNQETNSDLEKKQCQLSNLEHKNNLLNQKIAKITTEKANLESCVKEIKKSNQSLKEEVKAFENSQVNEMYRNNEEVKALKQEISEAQSNETITKNKCELLQNQLHEALENYNKLKTEIDKLNEFVPFKNESEYGYDMTIIMKSLRDLCLKPSEDPNQKPTGGIKIQKKREDLDCNFKNVILIGMQGQRNKGKTFILNSLVNENFPSDYHMNTPWISVLLDSFNGKNIVYIDSEGLRCPIKINYEQNQHYKKFMNCKLEDGEIDHKSEQLLSLDIQQTHEEVIATEQLQQEFIIENSNIIIVVVSQLTVDDQRLIHQISERVCNRKDTNKEKKILIVHNLVELRRSEYVKRYIEEDLKKIYPLEEQKLNIYNKNFEDENNIIFIDQIKPYINHVVLGFQKSDAGRVYNRFAFFYIKEMIQMYQGVSNLNVPIKLQEFLNKHLESLVTLKEQNDESTITQPSNELITLSEGNTLLHLKQGLQIQKVKELQLNVFGGINNDLRSSILESKENELVLIVEVPGTAEVWRRFYPITGVFSIKITQNQRVEDEYGVIQQTTRKFEQTSHQIQICKKDELWKIVSVKSNENLQNGTYKFVFQKEDEDDDYK